MAGAAAAAEAETSVTDNADTPADGSGEHIANGNRAPATTTPYDDSAVEADRDALNQAMTGFTTAARHVRDAASGSANALVATAVGTNVVTTIISIITSGTTAVSSGAVPATFGGAVAQEFLMNGVAAGGVVKAGMPAADFGSLWILLSYLQFISSSSHMSLPGAPDFFFKFTDSIGWTNLQPIESASLDLTHASVPSGTIPTEITPGEPSSGLSSETIGNFSVADGDIISGVLAYAQRLHIEPQELFTKTAIVFVSVVGGVAAVIATLYALVRCLLRQRLELVVQRLDELPRAKLLLRLLTQSCLSICLMSEYALSMTSSFQMRYNQDQHGGKSSSSALAFATVALIVVCFGLVVLGVVKIWGKTEEQLSNPDFKFAWGPYYKYYHHRMRYFFVAKMGAEILSGVVIGLVSDVPSQLTLLMAMQLGMFLFTVESTPYSMDFQTACSSAAFIMKMLTYALISTFLTSSTEVSLQDFMGTLVILLQVGLLLLFNSRQLYILYKQMSYLLTLRRERRRHEREQKRAAEQAALQRTSMSTLTPAYEETPKPFGLLESKRNSPASPKASPAQPHSPVKGA